MRNPFLKEKDNAYVSPKAEVIAFPEEDVIRTSNFAIGDESYDVEKDAIWFD